MDGAHMGLGGASPTALGWLRWGSWGKTLSIGRLGFAIKARGKETRVVGGLGGVLRCY